MAKPKKPRVKKPKAAKATPGHNSNPHDPAVQEELGKIAKAQRSLDNEKAKTKADWREREKKLTERLENVGFTRDQYKAPYKRFCEIADCDNDDEVKTVRENHRIFLAKQRQAFDALGQGDQINWIDLIQDADEIEKLRAEEAEKADAAAAESGEEAVDTPVED